ncbi:MAG: histidinol phosphate phosphatase domain-containing protein [candidate division Zixibacteria bacterium]|nr:histidinol phosphate phosphatase domain-containing protein [candidate division Zixibacteria bacterium]
MIDLHTHSVLSDGELLPAELAHRAYVAGYKALAITDHVDSGNLALVLAQLIKVSKDLNKYMKIKVLPGVEITHVPPQQIPELAGLARKLGAKIIVVHGESPVEPVISGTNLAGLESDIDILAHPGLITEKEIKLAKKRGIYLELSARRGHSLTNGYVAKLAMKFGAKLVINTDAHSSSELFTKEILRKVGLGAGLSEKEFRGVLENSLSLVRKRR